MVSIVAGFARGRDLSPELSTALTRSVSRKRADERGVTQFWRSFDKNRHTRESGVSSIPRTLGSIANALDYWIIRFRG
jgi:hypothetical protein